jgi:2-methylisocitrate lyase-like PEP mutase family enzyme
MDPVAELAELGVRRVSVGGAFAFTAYGALLDAAQELRAAGTYSFLDPARRGSEATRDAFT